MNKIISFVLLGALLLMCFSGCAGINTNDNDDKNDNTGDPTPNDPSNNNKPDNENGNVGLESNVELNNLFAKLQEDSEKTEKISYYIDYQDLHYRLKESGEYDDEKWMNPTILVIITCDYNLATDEDWYKACSDTDNETLNTAFFNEYSNELSEGHFIPVAIFPGLHFVYAHSIDTLSETLNVFYSDYSVLKQLIDLEYVKDIRVQYVYSVPGSYFDQ